MGASGWDYSVPYQEDLASAFAGLRRTVFEEQNYHWVGEDDGRPWPGTEEELWEDEDVQESGTHSILDIQGIAGPNERADPGMLEPMTEAEVTTLFGTRKPTAADVPEFIDLPCERWQGRCTVLHDKDGVPEEILFWGISGD